MLPNIDVDYLTQVLGRLLEQSPKANWDPASAPKEEFEEVMREPEPEIVEEVVDEAVIRADPNRTIIPGIRKSM